MVRFDACFLLNFITIIFVHSLLFICAKTTFFTCSLFMSFWHFFLLDIVFLFSVSALPISSLFPFLYFMVCLLIWDVYIPIILYASLLVVFVFYNRSNAWPGWSNLSSLQFKVFLILIIVDKKVKTNVPKNKFCSFSCASLHFILW